MEASRPTGKHAFDPLARFEPLDHDMCLGMRSLDAPSAFHRDCAIERLQRNAVRRVLVVAAHPDDETIGVGATLGLLIARGCRTEVLHVTDGAPRDPTLRPKLSGGSPAEASKVRRAEVEAALRTGGLDPDVVLAPSLDVPDQQAALVLPWIAHQIARRIRGSNVDLVVAHAYEGGHPDHDAVAFAVHAALALGARDGGHPPPLFAEMSSYHADAYGNLVTASFLPRTDDTCRARFTGRLGPAGRARKRRMLAAFASQAEVLAPFGATAEPLRCAPAYDFRTPPHEGTLHYERLPFGWSGARFCALADAALRQLGLSPTCA